MPDLTAGPDAPTVASLEDAIAAACARRPTIAAAGFAAHAVAQVGAGARPEHLDELLVAWAAGRGDPAAVRAVDDLMATIAPRGLDPAARDEVRQLARVRVLVASDDRPPRIAGYRGTGPLAGWLRVAVTRVAIDHQRALVRGDVPVDVLAELAAREPDPELRALKARFQVEWRAALTDALAALGGRPRVVLRLHFVEGTPLAAIGRLYRVHESTVSRWVRDAAQAVADAARARLTERLALPADQLDSIARMVRSQLDLSIARLLQG
ncbi:MAG: transcriptional regulator [Myxococcales bacterium]|nr:transcriptional regulator [Myxococcales bacterium]